MVDYSALQTKLKSLNSDPSINDQIWFDLNELIIQVHVPENKIIESRLFVREDFSCIPSVAKLCFQNLRSVLSAQSDVCNENDKAFLQVVYSSITLCGEHSEPSLWTDDDCVELSQSVLASVLRVFHCKNLNSFLVKNNSERKLHGNCIFSAILPKLSKDSWKYHPALVQCYSWLVHQITLPHMKHFIHNALPVSLNILTDYRVESKIIALNCLRHLISNVSKAELNWNIEMEVLHKILKPLHYFRESELIVPLTKCTLEVVDKSSSRFKDAGVDLSWSFLDEMLSIILPMMEYEPDMSRRFAYSQSLYFILDHSNLAIGKWSQRILKIIEDYAKIPSTELEAMMALKLFIEKCWPLIQYHWKFVNLISGRILYQSDNTQAISEAKIIIQMLKELLPEKEIIDVEYINSKRKMKK